jgi:hypothetical protein
MARCSIAALKERNKVKEQSVPVFLEPNHQSYHSYGTIIDRIFQRKVVEHIHEA